MTICGVQDCDRDIFARDWCQKHYTRWLRHGDPEKTYHRRADDGWTLLDRILDDVDAEGLCWLYTACVDSSGYGRITVDGQGKLAHRLVYEELVGELPEEDDEENRLTLDHLCRVRNCVNPDHLEVVTMRENTLRGMSPGAKAARTNRCKRDHDLLEHGYERPDGRGRDCLACLRHRRAKRKEKATT